MKYFSDNKFLLKKYSLIILFNIIAYLLCDFYFNSSDIGYVIMLLIVFIFNFFILHYKEKIKFEYYLDLLCNSLIGIILLLFIKDINIYIIVTFSLYLSNNIVFMKSRLSEKILIRSIEYALIFLLTLLSTIITFYIFYLIY